jgi:signal transduction histidine kinase
VRRQIAGLIHGRYLAIDPGKSASFATHALRVMHDLSKFSLADMLEIGAELRRCCDAAATLQAVAERIVRYFHNDLRDSDGARATALVRFFLTRPPDDASSLTLLAEAGLAPESSLPAASAVTAPMIAQLFEQFSLTDARRVFDVFHIGDVRGQDRVELDDVRSAVGFGGVLASGDLFAVILLTTVPVERETAELFQPLALSAKLALAPFAYGPIFPGDAPRTVEAPDVRERDEWRTATLEQLIDLHEATAIEQSRRLEERAASERDARQALHRVNERNVEYLQRIRELNLSLQQQVDQLEAVNQELEAFSYSVSHDLRAPLRHLSGFADLLSRENLDQAGGNAKRYVQFIKEASAHAGKLVDDLLSFARMGRVEIRRSRVDMNALVRLVIQELQPDVGERRVDWRVAELPAIVADPAMIAVVLKNLVSNALKFTATRDEALIEIDAAADAAETRFCVRDNGIGFDMQYLDKLFKVFQRLHRSEDFAGSGIGLAHVQRIVRRHGGRAWAEGKVDGGATFFFSLPNSTEEVTDGRH